MLARSSLAVAALITVLLATRQFDIFSAAYLQARHAELVLASSTRAVGVTAGSAATTTRAHIERAIFAEPPAPPATFAAPPPLTAPSTTEAPAVAAAPSVHTAVRPPVRHLPLEPMRPPAGARDGSVSGRPAAFGPDGIWRDWSDDGPSGGAGGFSGAPSLDERSQMLAGCRGVSKCGFMSPSGFDALREPEGYEGCAVVVLTAIFGRKDKLQQPGHVPVGQEHCYFAFVDAASASFLVQTAPRSIRRGSSSTRIGSWRLLVLSPPAPYADPRRNSRVPKLLPSRLFPAANFSLWLDGKLKLLVPPMQVGWGAGHAVVRVASRSRACPVRRCGGPHHGWPRSTFHRGRVPSGRAPPTIVPVCVPTWLAACPAARRALLGAAARLDRLAAQPAERPHHRGASLDQVRHITSSSHHITTSPRSSPGSGARAVSFKMGVTIKRHHSAPPYSTTPFSTTVRHHHERRPKLPPRARHECA